ncbi:phage holin family protein [Aeromicrobium sp.]|uniref:phage holin family protein n=1 Tax=Aeromicrobium sp. TaxID=1871063 RepID=UPI0028ADA817|nr:phage holin family protein [Aeromicrobium sp.]
MLSPRLWITIVTAALANAVSLALAAWVLPGFELTVAWWAAAVVLFTILSVVLRTVAQRLSSRWLRVSAITGGLALTAIALALTNVIVPDSGFRIHGWGTWVLVTLLVWAASVAFGEVDQQAPEKTPGVSPTTRAAAREGDRRAS